MKPADEIRQLFKNAELGIDSNADEKVFEDVFGAHKETTENAPAMPEIWRIIMKSRKAQFTAAAVAVLAIYLCLQVPKGLVAPAYALQDTIEAYNSMRYLHVKSFWTVGGEKWDSESWVEFDEDGKPSRFRSQVPWISIDKRLGPATFVQDGDGSHTWLPNLNLCFRRSGKSVLTGALLQYTRSDVDPKLVCEKLRQQARDGEIILDVNEPDQKNEPIVLVVTYPAESRSANWKKVLYIDQATRLVKKEEKFEMRGGQYQHERTTEFFDYNQPIDPEMFNLDPELPENVIWIDLSEEVGLAQGDMTDEEIATEVTSQTLQAFMARDFNKTGQLFLGVPGFFIEKLLGVNVLKKIISVGPVHRDPDPDSNLMICSCKIIYEIGGQYYEVDTKVYVVPVSGQPGRWMICRIWGHNMKPASGDLTQVEYEPTTEERARGFGAVQGSGPVPRPRLKKLEVDLGRNERDLVQVKIVGLSELDAVSIRVSGPGAALCTPWIEKDYQLHVGAQTPVDMNNPTRLWLEVDSGKHDPGEYKLTINLSSGRGTELRIPGTVTVHDVALPQRRTTRMKPFSWIVSLSGLDIHKPETRKRLEVFLDDMAALRITVCDWVYTYIPASVLQQVKITGTDQTLQAAGQAGIIDINNLPDLDFSFFDPWIAGSAKHGMTDLEINVRLYITEYERAFVKGVLGNEADYSDETCWKALMWLYSQFRDYVQSRGMTETWARIDTALKPDTIPDYLQAARRYQKIGYRTYTGNIDRFARNATWLNQLNAQSDSWYMSYWQMQAFLELTSRAWEYEKKQRYVGTQWAHYDNGGAVSTWCTLKPFFSEDIAHRVQDVVVSLNGKPLERRSGSGWANKERGVYMHWGSGLYVCLPDGGNPNEVNVLVTYTLRQPTQGKPAVQLDEGDQIWYGVSGNYTKLYEKARANAWRVCADGTDGYSWWCYWLDNSKNCIVWYDQESESMIHSPTWHGLRDGNEDAAYYHILQERLKTKGDQEGLARLAALTGQSKDAPLRTTRVKDHYGLIYHDIDPTNGYRQFNQAKREVLRMLCTDQ
jgi:hypothetical protein